MNDLNRKMTFNEMLNKSKMLVANELMFTATHKCEHVRLY